MPLSDAYCLAFAPFQGTCLEDLDKDDYTPETLNKELRFLENLTTTGFQTFANFFEKADMKSADAAAGLYCLSAFCNRIQSLCLSAGTLAGEILQESKVDYQGSLKQLTAKAKSDGLPSEDSRIEDLFDTEKDAEWEKPAASKGKVEFRHAVSMVAFKEGEEGGECMELIHQPVKPEFTRKKVRKATGYAKFNFSPEDLAEMKGSGEETEEASVQSSNSTTTKRVESDLPQLSEGSGKTLSFFCGFCKSTSANDSDTEMFRRSSSVSMGSIQEIKDKDADEHWNDNQRHANRFERIRGRIPTGHASLMKVSSDDALDALLMEDTEEGRRTRELVLHNTEFNKASPPSSICSSPPLSPEASFEGLGAVQREGLRSKNVEPRNANTNNHGSPLRKILSNLKRRTLPSMESYLNP